MDETTNAKYDAIRVPYLKYQQLMDPLLLLKNVVEEQERKPKNKKTPEVEEMKEDSFHVAFSYVLMRCSKRSHSRTGVMVFG